MDLPAPLGPVTATISPGRTARPRSRSSGSPAAPPVRGKLKPTPSSSSTGAGLRLRLAGVPGRRRHGAWRWHRRWVTAWITVPVRASSADRISSRGGPPAVAVPPSRTSQCAAERARPSAAWLSTTTAVPAPVSRLMRSRTWMMPGSVQGGERLVEHQHAGVLDDGAGHGQPAQFPAGEGGGVPVQERGQARQLPRAADHGAEHVGPRRCRGSPGRRRVPRPPWSGPWRAWRPHPAGRSPPGSDQAEGLIRGSSWPPRNSSSSPASASDPVSVPDCPGRSQPASSLPRVVLPLPEPPRTAVSVPGRTLTFDVAQRRGGLAVEAEAADPGGQHGARAWCGRGGGGGRLSGRAAVMGAPRPARRPRAGVPRLPRRAAAATARSRRWAGGSATSR